MATDQEVKTAFALQAERADAERFQNGVIVEVRGRKAFVVLDNEGTGAVWAYRGVYEPTLGARVSVERVTGTRQYQIAGVARDALASNDLALYDLARQGSELYYPVALEAINERAYNLSTTGLSITVYNVQYTDKTGVHHYIASATLDLTASVPVVNSRWVILRVHAASEIITAYNHTTTATPDGGWVGAANAALGAGYLPLIAIRMNAGMTVWGDAWKVIGRGFSYAVKYVLVIPYGTEINEDVLEFFTVAADSGVSQTITDGNTLMIAGGVGLSSIASATDTVTINLDSPVAVSLGGTGAVLTGTGAATHFVAQATAGAAFTVRAITSADVATALTTPPAIGGTTPSSGAFTTLTASTPIGVASGGTGAALTGTGAATHVVRQASAGAAFTVGAITSADLTTALTTPPAIGGTTPAIVNATTLNATVDSALTNSIVNVLNVNANSTGTPANGLGVQIAMGIESSTTQNRPAAAFNAYWTTVTDATRTSELDVYVSDSGSTPRVGTFTRTGINNTAIGATTPAAGAFTAVTSTGTGGTSFVMKQASAGAALTAGLITATELTTALTTPPAIGLTTPAYGGFTHVNAVQTTNGAFSGTFTSDGASLSDATLNPIAHFTVNRAGTPVAGFGGYVEFRGKSDTTNDRGMGRIIPRWTTVADISRTSELDLYVVSTGTPVRAATFTLQGINNTAIGTTTAAAGRFTAVTSTGTGGTSFVMKQASAGAALTAGLITATELTTALTTPPAIGGTTPAAGAFTTLSATSGIDSTTIGATTAATGRFTGVQTAIVEIVANTTLTSANHTVVVYANAGAITVTLPALASHIGRKYVILRSDSTANVVTIDGNGAEFINLAATYTLASFGSSVSIQADANRWWITNKII